MISLFRGSNLVLRGCFNSSSLLMVRKFRLMQSKIRLIEKEAMTFPTLNLFALSLFWFHFN